MLRRGILVLALVAFFCGLEQPAAFAHAGLQRSDPLAGTTLGASPTAVRLSFSEEPAPTLSTIRVTDTRGTAFEVGDPVRAGADPLTLLVQVRPLPRGVYTVTWRIVSAVDGHATAGAYVFGVEVAPGAAATAAAARTGTPSPTLEEILGRLLLIAGLGVLLGAATAAVARFGGANGGGWLAALGACGAFVGLALLADAQRRNAAASLADLLDTSVGRALVWRALGLVVVVAALLVARFGPNRSQRGAMAAAAVAVLVVMAVHVAAGHAAGGSSTSWPSVATQWAHFAAMGVWIGGLAALLVAIRGAASETKSAAVRRFSAIAVIGLLVLLATGLLRAFGELSWTDLGTTGYGRGVVAKTVLIVGIAAFAAYNRWRSVPAAPVGLSRLRYASSGELILATAAIAVAAVLGTLTPPADAQVTAPLGITATGSDFATTTRARLLVASAQPGPNRFTLTVFDYDSKKAVRARAASLRFAPLDDPGIEPSSLALTAAEDGSYVGTGPNLLFDGRWEVTALIERDEQSVSVPFAIDLPTAPQFVSVTRVPGEPPFYSVQIADETAVLFAIDPERPGPSKITVSFADVISDERPVASMVLTTARRSQPVEQVEVRRVSKGRFVADVTLAAGRTQLTATARTLDGLRLRATVALEVGGD